MINEIYMFKIGVFAIITDDEDRVLLCHRTDHDLWNLPGGGVEEGETPWDALIREVREETGLEAVPIHLTEVNSKPDKDEIVFTFTCQVNGGSLTLNNEADQLEYFALNQIPHNMSAKQLERLNNYFADKTTTRFKTQTGPSSIELLKEGKL